MFRIGARAARTAGIILGTLFLASAVLKALDMNTFAVQVARYGVVHDRTFILVSAWGSLTVETFLASALLSTRYRRPALFSLTFLILAGFTGLIAYAWAFKGLSDCGCFGKYVTMSPGVSIAKNIAMMALAAAAAWGLPRRSEANSGAAMGPIGRSHRASIAAALACVVSVGAAAAIGSFNSPEAVAKTEPVSNANAAPFAQFRFEADGVTYDLAHKEFLVAMLSATCDHCIASVPKLNDLAMIPEFPRMVALMLGDAKEIDRFRQETQPQFPTEQVKDVLTFFKFIGNAPPRLILIRDGKELQHWDEDMPGPDIALEAIRQAGIELKATP